MRCPPLALSLTLAALAGCATDVPTSPGGDGGPAALSAAAVAPAAAALRSASVRRVDLSSRTFVLDGAGVPYTVTVRNPNKTAINEVFLQAEVFQGASYRGAGGFNANCPVFDGTLPPGTCTMSFATSANNGNGGSGTLVAGPAEWVLSLYEGFTTPVVRDQVRVRITLVGP